MRRSVPGGGKQQQQQQVQPPANDVTTEEASAQQGSDAPHGSDHDHPDQINSAPTPAPKQLRAGGSTVFAQMVSKMGLLTRESLLLAHRVWKVKFVGELMRNLRRRRFPGKERGECC